MAAVDYLTRIIIEAVPKDIPMKQDAMRADLERLRQTLERATGRGDD